MSKLVDRLELASLFAKSIIEEYEDNSGMTWEATLDIIPSLCSMMNEEAGNDYLEADVILGILKAVKPC